MRFAADDVGAGYAGLNRMMRLAPEVIKLDRFLIAGVDGDPARQALTSSAAAFAAATRTRVIAEGIESAGELAALRAAASATGRASTSAGRWPWSTRPRSRRRFVELRFEEE